jgi:hypothetical protein
MAKKTKISKVEKKAVKKAVKKAAKKAKKFDTQVDRSDVSSNSPFSS